MADQWTLEQRLRSLLITHDDDGGGPIAQAFANVPRHDELTAFEHDLISWGTVVGMAFAFGRLEEPCESDAEVMSRVLRPARSIFQEFGGPFGQREASDAAIRAVSDEYTEAMMKSAAKMKPGDELRVQMTPGLQRAINALMVEAGHAS